MLKEPRTRHAEESQGKNIFFKKKRNIFNVTFWKFEYGDKSSVFKFIPELGPGSPELLVTVSQKRKVPI